MRGGGGKLAGKLRETLSARQPDALKLSRNRRRRVAALLFLSPERVELLQVGRAALLVNPLLVAEEVEGQSLDSLAVFGRIVHRRILPREEDPLPGARHHLRLRLHIRADHPRQRGDLRRERRYGQAVSESQQSHLAVGQRAIQILRVPRQHQRGR